MKRSSLVFACALMALPAAGTIPASAQTRLDTARIESLTGAQGTLDAKSGVFTVFLHYWGVGPAESLAKGLKAALAETGKDRRDR